MNIQQHKHKVTFFDSLSKLSNIWLQHLLQGISTIFKGTEKEMWGCFTAERITRSELISEYAGEVSSFWPTNSSCL
jgi:hypothetical protein